MRESVTNFVFPGLATRLRASEYIHQSSAFLEMGQALGDNVDYQGGGINAQWAKLLTAMALGPFQSVSAMPVIVLERDDTLCRLDVCLNKRVDSSAESRWEKAVLSAGSAILLFTTFKVEIDVRSRLVIVEQLIQLKQKIEQSQKKLASTGWQVYEPFEFSHKMSGRALCVASAMDGDISAFIKSLGGLEGLVEHMVRVIEKQLIHIDKDATSGIQYTKTQLAYLIQGYRREVDRIKDPMVLQALKENLQRNADRYVEPHHSSTFFSGLFMRRSENPQDKLQEEVSRKLSELLPVEENISFGML